MITSFNCNINLEVVSRYFKLDDKIMSMVYGDKPVKSSCIKKTNRPFFNQATIIVKLDPLRNINIKIFSNGKIQMTGVKKKIDGEIALKLIIEKLKITSGKVPLKNLLDSQMISYYLDITGKDVVEKSYYELDKHEKNIFLLENMIEKIYEIKKTNEINLFAESIENNIGIRLMKITNLKVNVIVLKNVLGKVRETVTEIVKKLQLRHFKVVVLLLQGHVKYYILKKLKIL